MTPTPKQRKCRVCKTPFTSMQSFRNWCSPPCGSVLALKKLEKKKKCEVIADRRETKAKLTKLKGRGYWLARAKKAVQKSRRLEELAKGSGCMSCLRTQEQVVGTDPWRPGGYWDGGHFLSKGSHPELALEPLNIWLQCKTCNAGGGKYARKGYTVNASFEANLIATQGQELVDWLKGPHELKHYTIEQLQAIEAEHTALARAIEKERV